MSAATHAVGDVGPAGASAVGRAPDAVAANAGRRLGPPARLALSAVVLVLVGLLSSWSLAPELSTQPAVAVGYAVIDISFTLTALLLVTQPGQAANSRLAAIAAGSSLVSHLAVRDIGALALPAVLYGGFTQVLTAALILRFPDARYDRLSRTWVRANLAFAAAFTLALALTSRPEWISAAPTEWWWAPLADPRMSAAVAEGRSAWRALAAATFLALAVRNWRRAARLDRRTRLPILLAAAFGAVMVGLDLAQWWLPAGVDQAIITVRSYTGGAVGLAFVLSAVRTGLARGGVGDLAVRLTRARGHEDVRAALRHALDDDRLEITYWVPEAQAYVTADGEVPSPPAAGRMQLAVADAHGEPLALLETDEGLRRHVDLLAGVTAVSRLALENARLQTGLLTRVAEVQQARARLMRAAFAERRRLEQDLHDGAQQRLLAVAARLALVESAAGAEPVLSAAVEDARQELRGALAELRRLAHDIHPALLSRAGLAVALADVADRLPLEVTLDVDRGRFAADAEGVAYFVTCEALANAVKHGAATTARVLIGADGDELVVGVSDDGVGWPCGEAPELPGLRDRVEAFGGSLEVRSGPGCTSVVARLPLVEG